MKIQNNSPHKYIAYSLALYYLSDIGSGIKSRESNVIVVSVFVFNIAFCYHIKILLVISNFLTIGKLFVNNWYQKLEDKLIREGVRFKINIS